MLVLQTLRTRGIAVLCALLLVAAPLTALAADPNKVLRIAFEIEETGFDPVKVTDDYSNRVVEQTSEPLLTYDYLARPAKLAPLTAETLPEVTDKGKTYLFHVRKGILFHPDPAFKGKRRELIAEDYAYSIKRLMDPKNRSPWRFVVDGKIVGLDELSKRAEKSARFDYDAKVPGLEVVDRYTLRIRLKDTDYNFAYIAAMPALSAMAREVIEAYPEDTNAHPIGTGPYILTNWVRKSKMILEANPDYRERYWDFEGSDDLRDKAAVAAMKGKRIPLHARIVAVADVFDALTHGRPYAPAWEVEKALEEIKSRRGTQFDPDIADRFVELIPTIASMHPDLDGYLGKAGRNSPFAQARQRIRAMLSEGNKAVRESPDAAGVLQ